MIKKSTSYQTFSRIQSRRDAISLPSSHLSINRLDDGSVTIAENHHNLHLHRASSLPPSPETRLSRREESTSSPAVLIESGQAENSAICNVGCSETKFDVELQTEIEEEIMIDLENPFFAFDDSLFDQRSQRSSIFEEVHVCFSEDQDPFVGILNEEGTKQACCTFKSFLRLPPEEADNCRKYYTMFGKRMRQFGQLTDDDIRSTLFDYWCWNWGSGLEGLREYLREAVNFYMDEDNVMWLFGQCSVCCAEFRFVRRPSCCSNAICQPCWQQYVKTTAANSMSVHLTGMYDLHCFGCEKFVPYSEALGSIDGDDLNLVRPPGHSSCSVARCPVCLKVPPPIMVSGKSSQAKLLAKLRKKRGGRPVLCDRCKNTYCSVCGMADHPHLSCKQLTVSDQGLLKWSKQKSTARPEFPNARRCPKCKINVTHSGGCPHMTCPCGAEWCFTCGRKYMKGLSFIFPSHTSNRLLPLVSCPKMWDSKPKRLAVHSLVGLGLVATGVPLAVALTPIVLPILGTVILVRKLRRRNR